jgi:hypothetical protein
MSIYVDNPIPIGQWTIEQNYGVNESVSIQHCVKVTSSIPIAKALKYAIQHPDLPHFADPIAGYLQLYVVNQSASYTNTSTLGDGAYMITVTTKAVNATKMDNGYLLYIRGACQSTTTKQDVFGQLCTVEYTYPGDIEPTEQVCELPWMKPSFEVVSTGISECDNPVPVIDTWLNKVNSATFWGINASKLLCTGVNVEPFSITSNPKKYKFQFTFSGVPDDWYPMGYFVDPQTNKTPPDVQMLTGYKKFLLYQSMDYNQVFPFAGVVP